jgi:hypothetical protein
MFASVRCYRMGSGSIDEVMHLVDEELATKFVDEPGFEGYQAIDCGDGRIVSVTLFRDEDGCERSKELAAEFVRDRLSDFQVERTEMFEGEVMVSRAIADLLEPVHH